MRREVRETVLFAVHDLLKDAPFSRMDLISCRNLLIYLNRDAQQRVLDTFHFALRPGGLLFLGSSESIDERTDLFRIVDKKHRIFRHQPATRVGLPVPAEPGSLLRTLASLERSGRPTVHGRRSRTGAGFAAPPPAVDRASLAESHFTLLERLSPPSVIVNADHEIVHLSEHAGRFLAFVGGPPSNNLLRVVHPMMRIELRAALFRAAETGGAVRVVNLPVELEGATRAVDLQVHPAPDVGPGFSLVMFEARDPAADGSGQATARPALHSEPIARQLERELEQVKGHLRDTVEQYEASTEEMKASNEELQAMNEELRSATEELETSREELQSINEELTTVNTEMKGKVEELANANADMQNLMASTAIATVFLDRELAITLYTPSAVELFHLIPTDLGRPLAHLKHRMDYPHLIADAAQVLRTPGPGRARGPPGSALVPGPPATVSHPGGPHRRRRLDLRRRHRAEAGRAYPAPAAGRADPVQRGSSRPGGAHDRTEEGGQRPPGPPRRTVRLSARVRSPKARAATAADDDGRARAAADPNPA